MGLLLNVAIAAAVATVTVTADMPPCPDPYREIFPDGTLSDPIYIKGSAKHYWEEDANGFTLMNDSDDPKGYKVYAKKNEKSGALESSKIRMNGSVNPKKFGLVEHLQPDGVVVVKEKKKKKECGIFCLHKIGSTGEVEKSLESDWRQEKPVVATTGTLKNLVVLMRFADHSTRNVPNETEIDILMNHVGPHPLAPTGSVRDVYLASSYGNLTIDSVIAPWVNISKTEAQCAGYNNGVGYSIQPCIREALQLTDATINFQQFDSDNDSFIDAITFLHSGYGAEWGATDAYGTSSTNRIWSHNEELNRIFLSSEGVKVSGYHISPSVWGISGGAIGRIGMISHEIGHFLGLPDLYDVDGDGAGTGSWGLMANAWGFDGTQRYPPPMCAWSKIQLGWAKPVVIGPGTYTLGPQCTDKTIYKITAGYPATEYLLIENRQPSCSFGDRIIPGKVGGLAIWHIDDGAWSYYDQGYPRQNRWPKNGRHYRVALLQSDRKYDLEVDANKGDAGDLWRPGQTLRSSTNNSTGPFPNTDRYQGGAVVRTGNTITNITNLPNGKIRFTYTVSPAPPTSANRSCLSPQMYFKLAIYTDYYGMETSWTLKQQNTKALVLSGSGYENYDKIVKGQCILNDCYTLTVMDSFGDGICCSDGRGYYIAKFGGSVVAAGGEFAFSESTNFGVCNALAPNPAS